MRQPHPMRLLVSVRNLAEAQLAAQAGVDFIDLKDPADGALGALPVALIRAIVQNLRHAGGAATGTLLSATTGDVASDQVGAILARVDAVASTGVDYVKVGIDGGPGSAALLVALAARVATGVPVVPVLLADRGIDQGLVAHALRLQLFPALMLDTADKGVGSLLDRVAPAALERFIATVRGADRHATAPGLGAPLMLAGLAGALRCDELPLLQNFAPDFAGFRSAVCAGDRAGALDPLRLQALCAAMPSPALGRDAARV